jgi:hypothetical protein
MEMEMKMSQQQEKAIVMKVALVEVARPFCTSVLQVSLLHIFG